MKIKKKFYYEGVELRIVEREEDYMGSEHTVTMIRVLAPNGGMIPILIKRRQTLKSIIEETITALDDFKRRGADVKSTLLQGITTTIKESNQN